MACKQSRCQRSAEPAELSFSCHTLSPLCIMRQVSDMWLLLVTVALAAALMAPSSCRSRFAPRAAACTPARTSSRNQATDSKLTGRAALLELVPNARTRALEKPRATSMGFLLVMNQNASGSMITPNITSPAAVGRLMKAHIGRPQACDHDYPWIIASPTLARVHILASLRPTGNDPQCCMHCHSEMHTSGLLQLSVTTHCTLSIWELQGDQTHCGHISTAWD